MATLLRDNDQFAGVVALRSGETFGEALAIHFPDAEVHSVEPTHRYHDCNEADEETGCIDPDLAFILRQDGREESWVWHSADGSMEHRDRCLVIGGER